MTIYAYTGKLSDIGLGLLTGANPIMRVRPMVEAFGPEGLVSAAPVTVPVNASTGAFTMNLHPSGELSPSMGGSPGVDYIIEVGRFEDALGGPVFHGIDTWKFTATAGGGPIADMGGGSLLAVWIGPPWPAAYPPPAGLYIDLTPPNEWGVRS